MAGKGGLVGGLLGFWRASPLWLKIASILVIALGVRALVTPEPATAPTASGPATPSAFDQCVTRGKAYFASIGSSPRLSDGRLAADVARERCGRTLTAF